MRRFGIELLATALTIGILFLEFGGALSTEGGPTGTFLGFSIAYAIVVAAVGFGTVRFTQRFPWLPVALTAGAAFWVVGVPARLTDAVFTLTALALGVGALAATLLRKVIARL